MELPSAAVFVTDRRWRRGGAGTDFGVCCRCFRVFTITARNTGPMFRAIHKLIPIPRKSLQQTIDIGLRDVLGTLAKLGAEPAHDDRSVGKLALFERFNHAGGAPGPLLGLANAVPMSRFGHIR